MGVRSRKIRPKTVGPSNETPSSVSHVASESETRGEFPSHAIDTVAADSDEERGKEFVHHPAIRIDGRFDRVGGGGHRPADGGGVRPDNRARRADPVRRDARPERVVAVVAVRPLSVCSRQKGALPSNCLLPRDTGHLRRGVRQTEIAHISRGHTGTGEDPGWAR